MLADGLEISSGQKQVPPCIGGVQRYPTVGRVLIERWIGLLRSLSLSLSLLRREGGSVCVCVCVE